MKMKIFFAFGYPLSEVQLVQCYIPESERVGTERNMSVPGKDVILEELMSFANSTETPNLHRAWKSLWSFIFGTEHMSQKEI